MAEKEQSAEQIQKEAEEWSAKYYAEKAQEEADYEQSVRDYKAAGIAAGEAEAAKTAGPSVLTDPELAAQEEAQNEQAEEEQQEEQEAKDEQPEEKPKAKAKRAKPTAAGPDPLQGPEDEGNVSPDPDDNVK